MTENKTDSPLTFATGHGIICAGLPRSGTLSLATALDILGVGPTHHGMKGTLAREAFAWQHAAWCSFPALQARLPTTDSKLPGYLPAFDPLMPWTRADWDRLVGRFRCTTDLGSMFSEQLIAAYPEAKVILIQRPVGKWVQSYGGVLVDKAFYGIGGFIKCSLGPLVGYHTTRAYHDVCMGWLGANSRRDAYEKLPARQLEHSAMVRRVTRPEQLLEFDLSDGWEPLCKFLGVPVPDVPFPYVNEGASISDAFRQIDMAILAGLGKRLAWFVATVGTVALAARTARGRVGDVYRTAMAWLGLL